MSDSNLGITFIENYKHYFGTHSTPTTQVVTQVIKDALHYNQLLTELRKRIHISEHITPPELIDSLSANYIDLIKQLKHDRRQLQKSLKALQEDANNIRISLHTARNTVDLLKAENNDLSEQLHQALHDREQLELMLMCKNTELLGLYASIRSKDHQLQQLLKEVNSADVQLESLIGMVKDLEKQILSSDVQLEGNAGVLNQIETQLSEFEDMLSILSENGQLQSN